MQVHRVAQDRRLRRKSFGLAVIAALAGGCADQATTPTPQVASVTIAPTSLSLDVGASDRLTATVRDADGGELQGQQVQWSSGDEAVAEVDGAGTVTGRGAGATTIRAEASGIFDEVDVTVVAPLPASLTLRTVATGITATHAAAAPGDSRLFLTGLDGRIWTLASGSPSPELFLDLQSRVKGGAHGLYSIAFHPDFATNRLFYVAYVEPDSDLIVERYTVDGTGAADPGSAKTILAIPHPAPYDHFGGWIGFGPDGMLYITSGDGGPGNSGNAQDLGSLLGKILRIDVDGGDPYGFPSTNPYLGMSGARPEIWAHGFRNPWRASFDPATDRFYVADVGEDDWEEINIVADDAGGMNFGWDRMEGAHCFPAGTTGCDRTGLTLPAVEYPLTGSAGEGSVQHPAGCSVTGGLVYRGSQMPELRGHYFYGDFCAGWIRSFRYENGAVEDAREWFTGIPQIISFGAGTDGELYVLTLGGTVYRIEP